MADTANVQQKYNPIDAYEIGGNDKALRKQKL
jgi:hypothetical protein